MKWVSACNLANNVDVDWEPSGIRYEGNMLRLCNGLVDMSEDSQRKYSIEMCYVFPLRLEMFSEAVGYIFRNRLQCSVKTIKITF